MGLHPSASVIGIAQSRGESVMRRFAGIDLGWASAAERNDHLNFRRMSYAGEMLDRVNNIP